MSSRASGKSGGRAGRRPQPQSWRTLDREWLVGGLVAILATAIALWTALRQYAPSYRLFWDDYALAWNSSSAYVGIAGALEWFTEGYTRYFWNYPDWPSEGFTFSRPIVNATFYLQSLFVPLLADSAYLIAGVVAVLASVALMMVALRRYTNMQAWTASLFAVAVGLSPVWHQSIWSPSFITNALATTFSLGALVVLDARKGVPTRPRMFGCVALLVLAVWSHETAIVMPLVCVALLYGMSPKPPRLSDLAPLAIPIVLLLVSQLMVGGERNYAADFGAELGFLERVGHSLVGPMFPFNSQLFRNYPRPLPATEAIPFYLGLLVNVAAIIAFAAYVRLRPLRRGTALTVAVLLAMSPVLWVLGEPRFGGFSLAVSAIVLFYLMAGADRQRTVLVAAVLLVQVLLFNVAVLGEVDRNIATTVNAGRFFDQVQASIERENPSTVVLVNDTVGLWGSRAMLQLAAWPREDVTLVVLNQLGGIWDQDARLTVRESGDYLEIENRLGRGQWIEARGNAASLDVPNQGFAYEPLPDAGNSVSFVARSPIPQGRTLVVGIDPADGTYLEPVVIEGR